MSYSIHFSVSRARVEDVSTSVEVQQMVVEDGCGKVPCQGAQDEWALQTVQP